MTDWDTRRHLKMADTIRHATAQSHTDSQESGQGNRLCLVPPTLSKVQTSLQRHEEGSSPYTSVYGSRGN